MGVDAQRNGRIAMPHLLTDVRDCPEHGLALNTIFLADRRLLRRADGEITREFQHLPSASGAVLQFDRGARDGEDGRRPSQLRLRSILEGDPGGIEEFAIANKSPLKIDVIDLSLGHPIYESAGPIRLLPPGSRRSARPATRNYCWRARSRDGKAPYRHLTCDQMRPPLGQYVNSPELILITHTLRKFLLIVRRTDS
jgi:hypothetical protein